MNFPKGYNERLYHLLDEATKMWYNEPKKALEIANFVYVHSLKSADEYIEAKSLYSLGVCNEMLGNYPQAMKFLSEAIKLSQTIGEQKNMADSLNCVGIINDNLNNYSNALKAYFKALKIYEELKLNKNTAIVLSNVGLIYTNIADYKNALKFYSQALDIAEEENDEESLLITNINIGLTHNLLGNYSESLKFLSSALELAGANNDKLRASIALDHISETHIQLKNIPEAYRLLEESKKIKLLLDDKKGLVKIYGTTGHLKLEEDFIDEAKVNLHKALDLADALGMKKSIFEIHKSLSRAYGKESSFEKALSHLNEAYSKELEYLKEESEAKAKNIATQLEIEQAQKEAEIQRLRNIELARALDDVKQLNVSLSELNEEKNEFMAIAVHDLKNPLQNILSTARVLKRNSGLSEGGLSENEIEEFTSNIISQTDRMFNLIKKLLDHNAIEQGNIKIRNSHFNVADVCNDLINNFKEAASAKKINILFEESTENMNIYSDMEILYEILQNILSNAIKFSPFNKNVTLKTFLDDNKIKFEISDEGPGFTENDKAKMFAKFSRLSAKPTGDEHSTGLGLSIVKKLSEIINAEVSLENNENGGSTFIISLPTAS